jgi:hypothetical protein
MSIVDEIIYGTNKIIQIWNVSKFECPNKKKKEKEKEKENKKKRKKKFKYCIECKYERKYEKIYEKKYKLFRRFCYCLLEQKLTQIRTLETEIATLKSAIVPPADKSVFLNEISIFCKDILFD